MNTQIKTPFFKKFIGDREFYRKVMYVAVPIMLQNGITNFIGLLDNAMVGQLSTEVMSGVAIVNQLMMIYFLCIFGGCAGAGIYTAQYYGQGNQEGIRNTFRFKLWMLFILSSIAAGIFLIYGKDLIWLYLSGSADGGDLALAQQAGWEYLKIILCSLVPFLLQQVYVSTLRECGETVVPMKAGICGVFVNLCFNYLLIYGKFGFPQLGVKGAALATLISRIVETSIVIAWTHKNKEKNPFIVGIYQTVRVPIHLAKAFFLKGLPLLINETLWSSGVAMITQCYSMRGLNVVAGLNIANTINNVFNVVFIAMGDAVAIIVGQLLGAGKLKEARDTDNKIIAFSVAACILISGLMVLVSPIFPQIYNTNAQAKQIATHFIIAQAVFLPQMAFLHACYFTLRSGGKTIITFLFDSVFMWLVSVPLAYFLIHHTGLYVIYVFACIQIADWIKCIVGFLLVKKGVWLQNIVQDTEMTKTV